MADNKDQWRGYDLEQLRYQIYATGARLDTQREVLEDTFTRMRRGNFALSTSTFARVTSLINYADFAVLGFKLWRHILPLLRKKSR